MGQKVSPIGFRLITRKNWASKWFANKRDFGTFLAKDRFLRKYLMKKPICVGTSRIGLKRMSGKIEVMIHTARPGHVIGKKGAEIELLKKELSNLTKTDVWLEVEEIKRVLCRILPERVSFVGINLVGHGSLIMANKPEQFDKFTYIKRPSPEYVQ